MINQKLIAVDAVHETINALSSKFLWGCDEVLPAAAVSVQSSGTAGLESWRVALASGLLEEHIASVKFCSFWVQCIRICL